jgi:hypothetical protein
MATLTAIVAVAAIPYLFFEMPIATLWSYVMKWLIGKPKTAENSEMSEKSKEADQSNEKPQTAESEPTENKSEL